eukprot:931453_1
MDEEGSPGFDMDEEGLYPISYINIGETSVLSELEARAILFDFLILSPLFLTLALGVFIVLSRDIMSTDDIYQRYAMHCSRIAAFSAILIYITQIFFCNNLIIEWNYTTNNTLVAAADSVIMLFYCTIKIAFYCGFTFHLQSIIYSHNGQTLSRLLKIGMWFITVYFTAVGIVFIVNDVLVNVDKEIGFDADHNISVTMVQQHHNNTDVSVTTILPITMIFVDLVYFAVLLFLYISKSRDMDATNKQKAVKGLVLIIWSCVFYWIFLIVYLTQYSSFWGIAGDLDAVADYICLFAMVGSGKIIYDNLCGLCHDCCGKLFFGANYTKLDTVSTSDDEPHTEDHLL